MIKPNVSGKLIEFFTHYTKLEFKRKQIVLSSDEEISHIYYITRGYVRAYRISENGDELTLLILKPGDFFPMTYGLNNMPNIYYLEALTPLVTWRAPQEKFLTFLAATPDVFFTLSTNIMDRFDGLLARMEYLVWSSAYTRIAAVLFICAKRFGKKQGADITIQFPLTHRDIATLVGLTRETTSLEMKKLEKKGLIKRENKLLTISNMPELERASLLNNQSGLLVNNFL